MYLQEKIERLIEERQVEAVKKNLSQKTRLIASIVGVPLIDYGTLTSEFGTNGDLVGYNPQHWISHESETDTAESELPIDPSYGQNEQGHEVLGYYFDGLTSGINLQIYLEDSAGFLKVTYQGNIVYQENQGKLERYIPTNDWENWIELLYDSAEKRAKIQMPKDQEREKTRKKKMLNRVIDFMKENWGI